MRKPPTIYAIDPGAKHVGVAIYHPYASKITLRCETINTDYWLSSIEVAMPMIDVLICESFVLYPGAAGAQSWQAMETSELIGATKWLAQKHDTEIVMQGASIKIPTRAICYARGITWKSDTIHANDAMLHLQHYLLKEEER